MKHKKISKHLFLWISIVLCLFTVNGCTQPDFEQTDGIAYGSVTTQTPEGTSDSTQSGELAVHYIDVGQGDATLITCGDSAMLIDAGNNNMGTTVQLYLKKHNIQKLDYVIGTHPDADHIGGLDVILYKFDWETFIMPDIKKDTKTYKEVVDVVKEKNDSITSPVAGAEYSLGTASFTILGPVGDKTGKSANNESVVIRLTYKDTCFLFNGDAEREEEQEILDSGMDVEADVYKVAHHGSAGANMKQYIKKVKPAWAVISCGADNSYGHPHQEVLDLLKTQGIKVFRTDEQGSVIAYSDGKKITWNQEAEEGEKTEDAIGASDTVSYILNISSGKFHLPSCSSVSDISAQNKEETTLDRDSLLEQGYVPCKRCHP